MRIWDETTVIIPKGEVADCPCCTPDAHDGTRQIMNFQNDHGMAKAYQVKQLLDCVDRHHLALEGGEHD